MSVPSVRRQVLVARDQAGAFRLFAHEIGTWWPLDGFAHFGAGATVALEGDRFVETSPSGETALWGTVTAHDPPAMLSFTWHPGRDPDAATQITVTFVPAGDDATTLVTLEHTGWEAYPDPDAARARYSTGWVTVLDRYVAAGPLPSSSGTSPPEPSPSDHEYWFVLQHTAGPTAPPTGVFSSPGFARHAQFLSWLRDEGVLVAAGPLPDVPGAGMTVVRAVGLARARRVVTAAQDADGAVTDGLLDVTVRPWRVVLSTWGEKP